MYIMYIYKSIFMQFQCIWNNHNAHCMKDSESEVAQSCPTLCNPMNSSLPGSAVHGIFQARILEWGAISFSRGTSQPRDQTPVSCIADRHFTVWTTRETCPLHQFSSVQFSSVAQLCPTLCGEHLTKYKPGDRARQKLLQRNRRQELVSLRYNHRCSESGNRIRELSCLEFIIRKNGITALIKPHHL